MLSRDKSSEEDLTNKLPPRHMAHVTLLFCSLFSSLFNSKLFRMNLKFNKKTSRKCYTCKEDRNSSLFTQEYAKGLFEAQGNIIYRDILRKRKATQDLICVASVLGKLKTLCWKSCKIDSNAIPWITANSLPVRKTFLVLLSTVVSEKQFFVRVGISKTNDSLNCKNQHLPKKWLRTIKQKNSYKKDLFVFWTFKGTLLDLNWFYRRLGR